jgi:DNA-binding transcriptional LysR family regulator
VSDLIGSIKVFRTVAETHSFTEAGKRLRLSTSAVSKAVAALESRYGVSLLRRTTRSVELTEIGEGYYANCIQILNDVEALESDVSQAGSSVSGTIRMSGPRMLTLRYVLPTLTRFLSEHPNLNIELNLTSEAGDAARDASADLALEFTHGPTSGLLSVPLARIRQVFCASPAYLKRGKPLRSPADLVAHTCIVYTVANSPWAYSELQGDLLKQVQVAPKILVNDPEAARQTVLAGLGVTMLPSWVVAEDLRSGALREIFAGFRGHQYQVSASLPRSTYIPLKTKKLLEALQALFAPTPPWERLASKRNGR